MPRELFGKESTSHNRCDVELTNPINSVTKSDTGGCSVCGAPLKRGATAYCGLACYRIVQRSASIEARFWPRVRKTATCWLWTGPVNRQTGYAQVSWTARYGRQRPVYVHRVAWELTNGPIPAGQSVLHRCDVPLCVNPDHLFLGTQAANMADAASKQRLSVPRHAARKLTDAQRADVRQRYAAGGVTMAALAQEFHCSSPHIWQIVHRRSVEFRRSLRKVS